MTNHDALRAALADRYRLDDQIGAGGMATVFLAHDLRHDRKVAIKVLRPELGALLGAERFLKEIRVTANLQHPAILTLHDSGEAAGLLLSGDRMMTVRVRTSPAFSASPPIELFHGAFRHDTNGDQSYDVAPDGRFLMMRSVSRGHVRVRVVKNWLSEALRSQSPAK